MNFSTFSKATELKKRLWFVLGALIVYRIGTYIPVPGIDPNILAEIFERHQGGVIGVFNMFSGGGLSRMSIFALAVMPYISASIIMQIFSYAIPSLAALKKDGEAGQRKINQYTRYGTVFLAALQGYGIAVGLEGMTGSRGSAVMDPGAFFRFTTTVTLIGGTMFLMWLGEQVTARGIGNGISLIIFAGIVANLPSAIGQTFELGRTGELSTPFVLLIILVVLALIALIVFIESAQRRVVIQYPRRQMGDREANHMPLKINTAGVIPPIFASSLLLFPLTIASFNAEGGGVLQTISAYLAHGEPLYIVSYVGLIVFFSFFYTSVVFNAEDTADNLKKNGGFIAGVRPGKQTADYLSFILTRLTAVGAIYMSLVCVMPEIFVAKYSVPFQLGGTGLLIVVNVVIDFVTQVQSHLFSHQYEGLIKKARLKGRIK
ncbi:MAG: preprotein translocase subunit SecY [Rickettsiales bacterium]